MLVVLKPSATKEQIQSLIAWLEGQGLIVHISRGEFYTFLGLIGDTSQIDVTLLEGLAMVDTV
ncbi:MAG: 3-deoxy-7-phosphoheptulonate synthase, partial [Synergistaceae bacterium]|nr:3-deoxy-7-phosphoheptulonate synthase [Synergistaceae bacterium]